MLVVDGTTRGRAALSRRSNCLLPAVREGAMMRFAGLLGGKRICFTDSHSTSR